MAGAGAAWAGLTGPVDRRVDGLSGAAERLRGGWSGAAASAANARLDGHRAELAFVAPALIEVDQVLADLSARLTVAKAQLTEVVARADAAGLLVDRAGGGAHRPGPGRAHRAGR
ncbi:hypothetical protein JM949_31250, partial [Micromonospora sp. STR1s_6]|nr:hypothetical protein [Micromonospora tarensis]